MRSRDVMASKGNKSLYLESLSGHLERPEVTEDGATSKVEELIGQIQGWISHSSGSRRSHA